MKKIAVVTGASKGIGKAIAVKYAKEGYDLAICCKQDKDALEQTTTEILTHTSSCISYIGDMGNYQETECFFSMIASRYPKIDVLVNNAGISYIGLLQDMSVQDWNHIISSNLNSVFFCCKLALPGMIQKKAGNILNISSIWGNSGASMEVAYSTSKGAVNAFTRSLAKELAPSHIQVNAIACGVIDTDMNAFLTAEEKAALLEEIPAGRMGTCEEVADLAYSITQKSDYLTGQIITFDGGFL